MPKTYAEQLARVRLMTTDEFCNVSMEDKAAIKAVLSFLDERVDLSRAAVLTELLADRDKLLESLLTFYPAADYHEDYGTVLWWHLPVKEPPYVGAGAGMCETDNYGEPTKCRRLQEEGWLTHWSRLPDARMMVVKA